MSIKSNIETELSNSRVNPVAREIWREALAQPVFKPVRIIWAYSAGAGSDHRNGRCCDFDVSNIGLSKGAAADLGEAIRDYFEDNAERLRLQAVIFAGQVTGYPGGEGTPTYRGPKGVRRRYTGDDQHHGHAHVQVRGTEPTSWLAEGPPEFTPNWEPTRPWVIYLDRLKFGVKGSRSVWHLQRRLLLPRTGNYGAAEQTAVETWQRSVGNAPRYVDGRLGPNDFAALFARYPAKLELQS